MSEIEKSDAERQSSLATEVDGLAAEKSEVAASSPPQWQPNFPEGGTRGWFALVGGWAVMFFTFGYMNAFG